MKRVLSLIVTLALVISLTTAVCADFSYSEFKNQPDLFGVSENKDEHYAFIDAEPLSTIEERSFEHDYASSKYYSYFYNDLIVFDYDKENAEPIWRLWIEYSGTKHIYISSVTFSFDGNDYTFTHLLDQQWISKLDNGDASQSIPIMFGASNSQFLTDMFDYISKYADDDWSFESLYSMPQLKITLHGTDDISAELPTTFYADFLLIYLAYAYDGYFDDFLLLTSDPTPLTVSTATPSSFPNITSFDEHTVSIPEHGLVTRMPNGIHWATLTEGDYEGLGKIYHKTPEQAKKFIETMGHCLMGFDPDSDLRVAISVIQMKVDVPNTKSQTDDEIMSALDGAVGTLLENTMKPEKWVLRTNNCVFSCNMYSVLGGKQLDCSTVVDGYMYQFLIRGTDTEQMKSVAREIANSTSVIVPLGGTLHLELPNVDITIPDRWELASHEVVEEEGTNQEYVHFYAHDDDGTSAVASLSLTDILTSTGPLAFGNRKTYDKLYTQNIFNQLLPMASAHTKNVVQTKIAGYDFATMPHNELENTTWVFGVGYGYSVNLLFMSSVEIASSDTRFIQLEKLAEQVLEAAKKN